jgi:uncharacterized protein (DUF927 family)
MTDVKNLHGQRIHAYKTITIPRPGSASGQPILLVRGSEISLTNELINELKDRHGNLPRWVTELAEVNPEAETEPTAALGGWPAEKSIFIRGELSWSQERQRRLDAANALTDPQERQQAISRINQELGLAVPVNSNTFRF